jgi:hypothetical protein
LTEEPYIFITPIASQQRQKHVYRQVEAIDFETTRVGTFVDLAPTRVYDKLHVDPARSNGFGGLDSSYHPQHTDCSSNPEGGVCRLRLGVRTSKYFHKHPRIHLRLIDLSQFITGAVISWT